MKNCNEELLGELLLGTQTALADAVTPQLRAVIVDYDEGEQIFYGNFFYDGEVLEEVLELWSAAITEASANIGAWDESRNICRIDYPNPIPDVRGRYAYYRKEPVLPNFKTEPRIASLSQKKIPLLACLKLDMQEILLGKVIPALRYILIEVVEEEKIIKLLIIYEGDNLQEVLQLTEKINEELNALYSNYFIDKQIFRSDFPECLKFEEKNKRLKVDFISGKQIIPSDHFIVFSENAGGVFKSEESIIRKKQYFGTKP